MKDPTLYVPVHAGLFSHRKLGRLSMRLGIPEVHAVGHLVSLWTSALQQTTDGVLRRWDEIDIARSARWTGKASDLLEALIAEEWIECAADDDSSIPAGTLMVRGWEDYAGRGMQYRETEKKRKAEARAAKKAATSPPVPALSADKPALSADVPRQRNETDRNETKRNEPELRESAEASTEPSHALPAVVPEADDQPDPPPSTEQRLERRESAAVVRSGYRAQIAGSRAASCAVFGRPQSVDDLLALHVVESPDGRVSVVPDSVVTLQQVWRSRYGALDGKGNPRRPSIAEVLERVWPSSLNKGWDLSGSQLLAWWSGILSTEANRVRLAWEKDGGASSSGTHPLWSEWRNLRNSRDMPPFEEWLLQRDREPAQQVGSGRRPQGPASGASAVARVVTSVLDAQASAAAEVFNDEAGYSSGLALMRAAAERAAPSTTTTTKTTKPGVLQ